MTSEEWKLNEVDGFLRLPEVLKVFPVGKTVWWEGVKSGRFPKPYSLSVKVVAWDVKDIRELIERVKGGAK